MFFHQQNSVKTLLLSLIVMLVVTGCDNGADQANDDGQETVEARLFSVGIGPLAEATVLLEQYVDGQGWVEDASVTSDENGEFDTSAMVFDAGVWYRFTATGGSLLDENFDGTQDDTVTFNGKLRAIASGDDLQDAGGLHIDFTAEIAYTHVLDALNADAIDWSDVSTQLDDVASQLFFADVNSDGSLSYLDIMAHASTDTAFVNVFNLYSARRMSRIMVDGLSSTLAWMPYSDRLPLHSDDLEAQDFELNADETVLYVAANSNGLYMIDLITGELTQNDTFGGTQNEIEYDVQNDLLYVGLSSTNGISVFDTETETIVENILSGTRVYGLDINAAGTTLYYGTSSGFFAYDIASEVSTTLSTGNVRVVRLSDDETTLLVGGNDFAAQYDLVADELIFNVSLSQTGEDVYISSDGTQAFVANSSDGFTLVDVENETFVSYYTPDGEDALNVLPLANGEQVLVLSEEGIFTFDLTELDYVDGEWDIDYLDDSLYAAMLDEEKGFLLVGSDVSVANTYVGIDRAELVAPINTNVYDVIINKDKNEVVFGENSELGFLDLETGDVAYISTSGQVQRVRLSEDGDTYFVSTTGAGIDLVDVEARTKVTISSTDTYHQVLDHEGLLYALNPTVNNSETIDVFNESTLTFVESITFDSDCEVEDIKMDIARDYLYAACDKGNGARRYHLENETWETFAASRGYSVELSDDEQTVFGGYYYEVYVVDVATNTLTTTLPSHGVMQHMEHVPGINGLLVNGSSGLQFIDLVNEEYHYLSDTSGYQFAYDADNQFVYLAANSDGLLKLDLSDF